MCIPVGDGEGIKDGIQLGTNVVGRHDGDIVGVIESMVVGGGVGVGEGYGEGLMDGSPLGRRVVGCHMGDIVETTGGISVGECEGIEQRFLVDAGPAGRAGRDGVDIINCTKVGQAGACKSMGDRVGTIDGMPLGGVFNGRAVGDGNSSINGVVLGTSVVGGTEGIIVGISIGGADGEGPHIKDGDALR